ncbi:valine--pyruvate transaminase [Aurantivibrio plasticivorans]
MKLSKFGEKFTGQSATVSLMDDLGEALLVNPNLLFLGGGNPAAIPGAQAVFQQTLQQIVDDDSMRHKMLGVYQPPQGDPDFLNDVARYLQKSCGWSVSARNIAVANGSQSAFSVLFNLFAGLGSDGMNRQIYLPITPEYVGYADVGHSPNLFKANRPQIDWLDERVYKYRVDFDAFELSDSVGMMCASRPTNPTGNVLTDAEIEQLAGIAKASDIPFVLDCAYGAPFPNITFTEAKPFWNEQTILVLSLSKLGLPGARTGIVVASEEVIQAYVKANTIMTLAAGNLGPTIAKQLLRNKAMEPLCEDVVRPFYRNAVGQAIGWVEELFADLPYAMHKPEGAIFLWLWFKGLPISSAELYRRLKARGVLVLAGEDFFVGLQETSEEGEWPHRYECIRLTYCQAPDMVYQGLKLIAEEVRQVFTENA